MESSIYELSISHLISLHPCKRSQRLMMKSVRAVFVGKVRHLEVIREGEATDGHGKE